ncbi:hypothetical protein ACIGHF_16030 [Stenotrophomonas sp. NPDC077464]|uniref:hypothetical protein n=1 Tax=unclassified Stenotrophomonas TaxID=196198 RepID=UPI0037D2B634
MNLSIVFIKPAPLLAALIALGSFNAVAATPSPPPPPPLPYEGAWELKSCTPFGQEESRCEGQRLSLVIAHSEAATHTSFCGTFVASNQDTYSPIVQGTLNGAFENAEPDGQFRGRMFLQREGSTDPYAVSVHINDGELRFLYRGYTHDTVKWPIASVVRLRRVATTEAIAKKQVELRAVCKKWEEESAKYTPKSP